MATDPLFERYQSARNELVGYLGGCGALLLVILLLPKDPGDPFLRLVLTIAFFTSAITLVWSLTSPFEAFVQARFAFRFQDCGQALENTVKLFVHSCGSYVRTLANLLLVLLSLTMVRVLAAWPEFDLLRPLQPTLTVLWWLSLAAVPLYVIGFLPRLTEVLQRKQGLDEQMATSGFSPIDEGAVKDLAQRAKEPPVVVLEARRFRAGGYDWGWADFYKNSIIFGQSGSGKTVCVLNALIDGLLASTRPGLEPFPASGLILDPKGDFRGKIAGLCARTGRSEDLLILDPANPEQSIRWNPFDSPDDELELAGRFAAVLETLGMKNESDSFWIDSARTFIRHAIALIRATNPPGLPPDFADIMALAGSEQKVEARLALCHAVALVEATMEGGRLDHALMLLAEPANLVAATERIPPGHLRGDRADRFFAGWIKKPQEDRRDTVEEAEIRVQALQAAGENLTITAPEQDPEQALDYFGGTWLPMAEKTRSGIQSYIVNMVDPFLMTPYREIFAGRSTCSIAEMLDDGKILYVYMPIADKETMARVICTFVKLEFYREVLKRPDKDRPSFFFCDEFQSFFTAGAGRGDADLFERSRQSNHANVIATQNLQALLKQVPDDKPVMNLLGNCAVKIFLRNTEEQTNEYASSLFGEKLEVLSSSTRSIGGAGAKSAFGGFRGLTSSTQYGAVVGKGDFAELAQPSREDGIAFTETIVHMGARAKISREKLRWRVHPLKSSG